MVEPLIIAPQKGYQEKVLSCGADIIIGGSAAGVGKTYSLLLEPLRNMKVPGFGGVIFRRTSTQIRNEGGLWDTSMKLYPYLGAEPKETFLEWNFENGNKLKFSHLEHEKNILDWQGSQIPFIGFDELQHFSKKMFFYLLTRNRSTCGVDPYMRATCNPDPEGWVADFVNWWINQETGFPIPERDGVIRYLIIDGENCIWGDTKAEVIEKAMYILEPLLIQSNIPAEKFVKSVSFVSGSIYDNKELLSVNPGYVANLLSQDAETKSALLDGNWKAIISDKDVYNYYAFLGLFNNSFDARTDKKYISADIALKGANKFIVGYWEGDSLEDILIMDKSKGNEVIDGIKKMCYFYNVENRNVVFDNDGVGQFVDGYIQGAREFNNGSSPLPDPKNLKVDDKGKELPENYENLKTQCYYRSGNKVNRGKMRISEKVADTMYDDKMTVRQRFMYERKAIKRAKTDMDGKLRIIKKDEMKTMLNGESPDLMDMFMMKDIFELKPKRTWSYA